jgi:hypothetical protein
MSTLDKILLNETLPIFKEDIEELANKDTWSPQNRDQLIERAFAISKKTAHEGINVVTKMLQEFEGTTIIGLVMEKEFLADFYQYLSDWRTNLDTLPENEVALQPVTYDWLTQSLRKIVARLEELEEQIEGIEKLSNPGTVEEI